MRNKEGEFVFVDGEGDEWVRYDYYKVLEESTRLAKVPAQHSVHWTAYAVLGLGVFALGMIFGYWLAGI